MSIYDNHVWGIILAAGDGKRLQEFVLSRFNSDCPKQFCTFTGTRSMLAHTIARVQKFIPPERIIAAMNSAHREYAKRDVDALDERNIIFQPSNKETTASVFLPLLHILRRDPDARVIVFPSDHFILEEERFMDNVAAASDFVDRHPKYLLLLGIDSKELHPDYGWIETDMKIGEARGYEVFRVKRFLEKPSSQEIDALKQRHFFLNTMVFAGSASMILRRFRRLVPKVYQAFKKIDAHLLSPHETQTIDEVYSNLPSVDFSAAILERDARGLAVLCVKDVYWSDWGSASRIVEDLAKMGGRK